MKNIPFNEFFGHEARAKMDEEFKKFLRSIPGTELMTGYKVLLTPDLASQFLQRNKEDNRAITPARVSRYAGIILEGGWRFTGEAILFSVAGELINGQHRCHACIEADTPIEVFVLFDLPNDAYKSLDQGKSREAKDYIADGQNKLARAAAAKLFFNEEQISPGSDPTLNNHYFAPNKAPEVLSRYPLAEEISPARCKGFLAPAMSIYCLTRTAMHNQTASEEFWTGVVEGVGLPQNDARLALRNWLSRRSKERRGSQQNGDVLKAVIYCWRAYLENRQVALVRPNIFGAFKWPGNSLSKKLQIDGVLPVLFSEK
jgi:hypothetical protein